jgi:uncharacterized protein
VSRLPELAAKVDAFFARVAERHAADLECGSGCADCCHTRLTVTAVEADAIRAEVAAWPHARSAALAATVAAAAPDRCAALDAADRCAIYAARPLVCRSHGAPIRLHDPRGLPVVNTAPPFGGADGRGQAPTVVQVCPKNFTRGGPAAADADCILDQTTLSALLLAVDREATGGAPRIDLAALLRAIAV